MSEGQAMRPSEEYVTRDLHLAAALVTSGLGLDGVDVQQEGSDQKRIGYFRFASSDELKAAIRSYQAGNSLVEPRAYSANVKSLKSAVGSTVRAPRR